MLSISNVGVRMGRNTNQMMSAARPSPIAAVMSMETHPVKQQQQMAMQELRLFFAFGCVAGGGSGDMFAWCSFVKWNGFGALEYVLLNPLLLNVRDILLINFVVMSPPPPPPPGIPVPVIPPRPCCTPRNSETKTSKTCRSRSLYRWKKRAGSKSEE